jgi:hypothetical protein
MATAMQSIPKPSANSPNVIDISATRRQMDRWSLIKPGVDLSLGNVARVIMVNSRPMIDRLAHTIDSIVCKWAWLFIVGSSLSSLGVPPAALVVLPISFYK